MGACCSNDSNPDAPDVIKPDPAMTGSLKVVVAALGSWGAGHDYGVWENERPEKNDEANKCVWMWFNKTSNDKAHAGQTTIRLENFVRTDPNDPKLGKILFYCLLQKKPTVQYFQRFGGRSNDMSFFHGFHNDNFRTYDDNYYMNHNDHRHSHAVASIQSKSTMVTKWQSYNTAKIYDGNLGRGEEKLGKNFILLDCLALGTTVTTYLTIREEVEETDAEGHKHRRWVTRHEHHSNTFVDSVQYRVTVNNLLWSEWSIPGDSAPEASMANSVTVSTPFFNTTLDGGWFKRTKYHTTTNNGIDPALAMLFSHLICTEFSVPEIKNDLNLPIPTREPAVLQPAPSVLTFALASTTGNFVF
jgi:hypothetical protein